MRETAFLAWQQYAMQPKPRGTQAMGFSEYLEMLGLAEDRYEEPSVTVEEALAIAEHVRAADRRGR